ncbi:hypothetical protein HYFRA_00012961 [Hymenoscyphus fraxineus]|uniref:Uncharacterized protein n=1 Tax=Hymenoscyphus fraxineus TaxID=746836 RepID=A0A9N9L6T3_9HELO|nr:hypothetical protein HYFRA_00012961 [Hymenoscyphus fraxineus]
MDPDNHPDRLTEPHEPQDQHRERTGSMSLGANLNGDDVSPLNGDSAAPVAQPAFVDPNAQAVSDVVSSEIGVSTLLNRLKQSLASAKEFATFLKKRSTLEEEHSAGLKKLCRSTSESIRRPDHRHGSFLQSYEEINTIHERMADNGAQFAMSLHQMHEDLLEMVANIERGRKHWKTNGMSAEQRAADSENLMRKSKHKYDSLAEDYDRAKTGDRQAGKKFGLKGPKSAAQHEEDLLRKLQAADADYAAKVLAAQGLRQELLSKLRPDAVKSLQELIKECDSAVTLQMQKFASFNEKLLLSNGMDVSPIQGTEKGTKYRSLREVVQSINNEQDLSSYISSFVGKIGPRNQEIKYERHPVLNPGGQSAQRQSGPPASYTNRPSTLGSSQPIQTTPSHQSHASQPFNQMPASSSQQHERNFSGGSTVQQYGTTTGPPSGPPQSAGGHNSGPTPTTTGYNSVPAGDTGPPQLSSLPFQTSQPPPPAFPVQQHLPSHPNFSQKGLPGPYSQPPISTAGGALPPLRPVFGLTLEELFERDMTAVPMVVSQCIQAVDLFGLEVEGIYRVSGTASHINKIKSIFDNDASKVDFRHPENFFQDVNSVAGLLKQFFRELPDPLLTTEHYAGFIEAAKHDDDIVRRDSLHAIINSLPDPNYATLRALTLHLDRVQKASAINRMNASNLAVVFGPTLMGTNSGPNIADSGWQVKVIDTILQNTLQIFDDD